MAGFRLRFYRCLTARADALFESAEALLCTDGPVNTLVGLSLAPEHRRGHGALYDALDHGRIEVVALRRQLSKTPGRLVLAVDVSPWLRPDGDRDILIVLDAGYEAPRIAWLLRRPTPPRVYQPLGGRPAKHGAEFVFR